MKILKIRQHILDSNVFEEKSKISPAKSKLPLLSKTSSPKSGSLQRQRKSSESLKTDSGFGSNTTSASSLPQVDRASPSVPHRKPSRPNSRPPSRDQSRPNSSNNNYARIEATESKVIDVKSLEAWEERLCRWEAELKKRESYLFDVSLFKPFHLNIKIYFRKRKILKIELQNSNLKTRSPVHLLLLNFRIV